MEINQEFRQESQECCLLTMISGSWVTASPIWYNLCALPGRTDGETDPTSQEETSLAVGWSTGGTQQLILVKVCQGLVGMRGLETSLSLQENVGESPAVRVGLCGCHKQTGVTQSPHSSPSVNERQKQSCLAA